MEIRLKSEIFGKKEVVKKYSKNLMSDTIVEIPWVLNNEFVDANTTDIQLNGILLSIRDITVKKKYSINVCHDSPLFKLHFELEGDIKYIPKTTKEILISIPNGHYNLFYLPTVDGVLGFNQKPRRTLEIQFTEAYINKNIGATFKDVFVNLGEAINKNELFLLSNNSRPIEQNLKEKVTEIIECKYKGITKKAYLEAKILELLVVVLAQSQEDYYSLVSNEISQGNYNDILKIDQYIQENLNTTLTIEELSKVIGFNTSKLKKCFKIVFKTTIFKHVTMHRMQRAKELIEEKEYTISEISYEVGYKNPQHFTVAFKKFYGFLPSSVI